MCSSGHYSLKKKCSKAKKKKKMSKEKQIRSSKGLLLHLFIHLYPNLIPKKAYKDADNIVRKKD